MRAIRVVVAAIVGGVCHGGAAQAATCVRDLVAADRAIAAAVAPAGAMIPRGDGASTLASSAMDGTGHGITPLRAFIFSALVPGTGELAQGSATGFGFLAVEAVGWTGWAVYNHRGHKGEDEYRAFVDQNYSRDAYQAVVNQVYDQYTVHCDPAGGDTTIECVNLANYFSLDRDTHSGHYYEDVGKLDKYIFGWRDWAGANWDPARQTVHDADENAVSFGGTWAPGAWPINMPPFESAMRAHYQDMRRSANRNFAHADDFSWVLLLNRAASAFHAAWLARRAEGSGERGELQRQTFLVLHPPGLGGTPRVALGRRF